MNPWAFLMRFLKSGHERSAKAKKNIVLSLFLRGINILVGLLLVPLVLMYIGQSRYGIWLTLSSIILWMNFLDVGLGHGLRNKLTESLAKGDMELARKYVSTAYITIGSIAAGLLFVGLLVNQFLDWSRILAAPEIPNDQLNALAIIVFSCFTVQLLLNLIMSVILANQAPALRDFIDTIGKVLMLIVLYILTQTTQGSLVLVGVAHSITPVVVLFIFSVSLYATKFRRLTPSFALADRKLVSDLMNVGVRFFILQIAAVVLYSTDNMIITHLFSPAEVTPYNIANRYFGIGLTGFSIIVSPLWSAVTEAHVLKDMAWIKASVRKLIGLWFIVLLGIIGMLGVSAWVYDFWLSGEVVVPFAVSLGWAAFVAAQSLSLIFVQVINGVGALRVQMILGITGAILNIPLSIVLSTYAGMGVTGVIVATLVSQVLVLSFMGIQYHKFTKGELHGIWAK